MTAATEKPVVPAANDREGQVAHWEGEFAARLKHFEAMQRHLETAWNDYVNAYFDLIPIGENMANLLRSMREAMQSNEIPPRRERRGSEPKENEHEHEHKHRGGRVHSHPHQIGDHHPEDEA